MGVFVRTLVVCLVVCIGYYFYQLLGKESYQGELSTNKTTVTKEVRVENKKQDKTPVEYAMKICFLVDENTVKYVERKTQLPTIQGAIEELLKGPTQAESARGIYTEIPQDVKLMWVKDEGGKIIINLTRNFEYGGGTKSIQNRIRQIKMTVDNIASKKPVYLYLDGKQVEYMGGEGIYIEQPL